MKYYEIFKNDGYKIYVVTWKIHFFINKILHETYTYHKTENILTYDNYFVRVLGLFVILIFLISKISVMCLQY